MDERAILDEIHEDLNQTPAARVIYLEGETDPAIFFGVLGVPQPAGDVFLHQTTLVKGLPTRRGSGNEAVKFRVEAGHKNGYGGRVFGIIDGDGVELAALAQQFDAPFLGPLFAWKAYSIESLLPQTGWPARWGSPPIWQADLLAYAPYIAFNRLHKDLSNRLETLRLHKFLNPINGQPLETVADISAALQRDQHLLNGYDVATEFTNQVARYRTALTTSLEDGLALLNGKWLLDDLLNRRDGKNRDSGCQEWITHATTQGGLAAVRDLWQRITGSAP